MILGFDSELGYLDVRLDFEFHYVHKHFLKSFKTAIKEKTGLM